MIRDKIQIRGARVNNLKNIDVDIPRNKLVVLTGLSGSGKSSLAFDTVYASHGQLEVPADILEEHLALDKVVLKLGYKLCAAVFSGIVRVGNTIDDNRSSERGTGSQIPASGNEPSLNRDERILHLLRGILRESELEITGVLVTIPSLDIKRRTAETAGCVVVVQNFLNLPY